MNHREPADRISRLELKTHCSTRRQAINEAKKGVSGPYWEINGITVGAPRNGDWYEIYPHTTAFAGLQRFERYTRSNRKFKIARPNLCDWRLRDVSDVVHLSHLERGPV